MLKGEVRIRRAVTQKVPAGDAAWTEARRWFLKANRLALENPLPIALYYYSFRAAGVPASNGAVSGMLLAAKTAPQDTALQLAAASELVRQKRNDEGIALLRRITASSHDEKAAAALSPVIGDIGKADPERLAKQLEAVSEALRRD
jgi:hypothetical protein